MSVLARLRSFLVLSSVAALVAVVALSPAPAEGRSTGSSPGFAGDVARSDGSPQTCAVCHSSFDLNSGTGSVGIDAAATAEPGQTVPVTITLDNQTPPTAEGSARQGFEVTVRDPATGEVWGRLLLADVSNTRYAGSASDPDTTYVTHTLGGSSQTTWTVDWQPGAERSGTARIYVAGNAANGNGTTSGDYIYATTADVVVAPVATPPSPSAGFAVGAPHPNPLRAGRRARLDVAMERPGDVTVTVLDGVGRAVRPPERWARPAGDAVVEVNTDGLAAGLYFVRVEGPGGRQTQPLAVVR